MGCHQNMVNKQVWAKVSEEGRLNPQQHIDMMNKMIQYMAEKGPEGQGLVRYRIIEGVPAW